MSDVRKSIRELEDLTEKLIYEKEFYSLESEKLLEKKIEKLIEKYRKANGGEKEEIARALHYIQKKSNNVLNIKNYLKKEELREFIYFAKKADKRDILKTLEECGISEVEARNNWFKFKIGDKRINLANRCLNFKIKITRDVFAKEIPADENSLDKFISYMLYSGKKLVENKPNERVEKKSIFERLKFKRERRGENFVEEKKEIYDEVAIEIKNLFKKLIKYVEKNSGNMLNAGEEATLFARDLIKKLSPLARDLIKQEFLKYDFQVKDLGTIEFIMQKSSFSVENDVRKIVEIIRMPSMYESLKNIAYLLKNDKDF